MRQVMVQGLDEDDQLLTDDGRLQPHADADLGAIAPAVRAISDQRSAISDER